MLSGQELSGNADEGTYYCSHRASLSYPEVSLSNNFHRQHVGGLRSHNNVTVFPQISQPTTYDAISHPGAINLCGMCTFKLLMRRETELHLLSSPKLRNTITKKTNVYAATHSFLLPSLKYNKCCCNLHRTYALLSLVTITGCKLLRLASASFMPLAIVSRALYARAIRTLPTMAYTH